jgi:hypothetical protein
MKRGVKLYTKDGNVGAEVYSVERDGNKLIMDVKVLDAMRMDMILTLDGFLYSFKIILSWGIVSFILFIPYMIIKRQLLKLGGKLPRSKAGGSLP